MRCVGIRTYDASVPNQPKTPMRSMRIPDDVWEAAKTKAAERDETVTAAVVRFLREYGESD